jgi:hypothetical protein
MALLMLPSSASKANAVGEESKSSVYPEGVV